MHMEQVGPLSSHEMATSSYSIQTRSIQLGTFSFLATVWGRAIYECDGQVSKCIWIFNVFMMRLVVLVPVVQMVKLLKQLQ